MSAAVTGRLPLRGDPGSMFSRSVFEGAAPNPRQSQSQGPGPARVPVARPQTVRASRLGQGELDAARAELAKARGLAERIVARYDSLAAMAGDDTAERALDEAKAVLDAAEFRYESALRAGGVA